MVSKILIANRGEIACRIIRTARRMGIATVAIYSDADRDALHVASADEAIHIGPAQAAQSYLAIEKIIAACKATGAQAVHPGYGFLSERAAFAEALDAAGIIFIGPNPKAIAAMGDKIQSKKAAAAAGVSTVPGFLGVIETAAHAAEIAKTIGYPVMIKASAGGGGKGMRIIRSAAEVAEAFARSKSEAASSFGDDRVFIEKFIENPRHIEIQVLGDKHGNVIHLGERECSVQRRNQKVLEEAPSPLLDTATRALMGSQAVALAKAVQYDSAGTVEFVVSQDRAFYFLEMNTRLQVEHPVTEMVTGRDLVEDMIRIAAGETLNVKQSDVTLTGWAVEARIYAEDPTRGFLPSAGRLVTYQQPAEGFDGEATIRVDTGVAEGGAISVHYDPIIAKLVTHAPNRKAAIAAQARALDSFAIGGIGNNLSFLATLMHHPRWREGRLATGLIAEEFGETVPNRAPQGELARRVAAVAAAIHHQYQEMRLARPGRQPHSPAAPQLVVSLAGGDTEEHFPLTTQSSGASISVAFTDGETISVATQWRLPAPIWSGTVAGQPISLHVSFRDDQIIFRHAGTLCSARVRTVRTMELIALMPKRVTDKASDRLVSPMPGRLGAILVQIGGHVAADQPLAVVEAMKMEMMLRAKSGGRVAAIYAKAGDMLAVDTPILLIQL